MLCFAYKVHPSAMSTLPIFLLESYAPVVLKVVYVVQPQSFVFPRDCS